MDKLTNRLIRILPDPALVGLVTALTGGSVPEYVIRDQARRARREQSKTGQTPGLHAVPQMVA